jgi:hypothetical protein
LQKRAWSRKLSNLTIPAELLKSKSIFFVIAVSAENGLEGLEIRNHPIDSPTFCQIFDQVLVRGWNCLLIWDNHSIHTGTYT